MTIETDNPTACAVIIGRAGSKGLPGKNERLIAGRPMVSFSIADAQAASTVSRTLVSTDSTVIADQAQQLGVECVDRPARLADDAATVDAAVRHAVETARATEPIIVILYCNVPVRPDDLIDRAVRELASSGADSVQSYAPVGKYHPMWMSRLDSARRVMPYIENDVYRRQDLPELFIPDGGVIAVHRASLFTSAGHPHAFLGRDRRGVRNPAGAVIDIDSDIDLAVAEAMVSAEPAGA